MTKKNVLIVSYIYPPANSPAAQRPYAIAKYLNKNIYNVTVVTCGNPDSSLGFDNDFNSELENVKLIKINGLLGNKASGLREVQSSNPKGNFKSKIKSKLVSFASNAIVPDRAIFWLPSVKKYIKQNENLFKSFDYILTTSPAFTNHLIGRTVKKRFPKIKWVLDVRDFHFVAHLEYSKGHKKFLNKRIEKSVFKKCDNIVFISNSMRQVHEEFYPNFKHKMRVVYNGFDLEDFADFDIKKLPNNKLTIFYAGSFYGGVRSPLPLFELLDAAIKNKIITDNEIEVVIAGNLEKKLQDKIETLNSGNCLSYLGRLPRGKVLEKLTKSTLLWLIVSDNISHYAGVPIKFYEYLAARRPIINFAPNKSEPTYIIEQHNLGWNIDIAEQDMETQLAILKNILASYKTGELLNPLPSKFLSMYSRDEQTKKVEQIFEE